MGGGTLEYELKILWLFAEISGTDLNPHSPPSSNNHPVNGGGLWSPLENVPHGLHSESEIKHITSQQILHQGAALFPRPTPRICCSLNETAGAQTTSAAGLQ